MTLYLQQPQIRLLQQFNFSHSKILCLFSEMALALLLLDLAQLFNLRIFYILMVLIQISLHTMSNKLLHMHLLQ